MARGVYRPLWRRTRTYRRNLFDPSTGVGTAFHASTAVAFPPSVAPTAQGVIGAYRDTGAQTFPPSLVVAGGIGMPFRASAAILYPPSFTIQSVQAVVMPFRASAAQAFPPFVEVSWVPEPDSVFDPDRDLRGKTVVLVWFEAFLPD